MIGFNSFSYTDVDAEALKLLSLREIKKYPLTQLILDLLQQLGFAVNWESLSRPQQLAKWQTS